AGFEAEGGIGVDEVVDGLRFTRRKRAAALEIVGGQGLDGCGKTILAEAGETGIRAGRGAAPRITGNKETGKAESPCSAKRNSYHKRYFPKIKDSTVSSAN